MNELLRIFEQIVITEKLSLTITSAPNGDMVIHIFALCKGVNHIAGSDKEIVYAQERNFEECAQKALKRLREYLG